MRDSLCLLLPFHHPSFLFYTDLSNNLDSLWLSITKKNVKKYHGILIYHRTKKNFFFVYICDGNREHKYHRRYNAKECQYFTNT
ncbi:unnamed protein product [Schistosoma mattheei]|uniref:Uncharacterized protein n=1 Tax=Schistosoma mattheei TaxID=31246 RepID=A0AA85BF23_9TREM|nr:unnamed protein product [Schistosoma mattheei]